VKTVASLQNNSKTEYVSVVQLCTNPPQFFNGVGPTPDEASDSAAVEALTKLSDVGLESLCGQSQTASEAASAGFVSWQSVRPFAATEMFLLFFLSTICCFAVMLM